MAKSSTIQKLLQAHAKERISRGKKVVDVYIKRLDLLSEISQHQRKVNKRRRKRNAAKTMAGMMVHRDWLSKIANGVNFEDWNNE